MVTGTLNVLAGVTLTISPGVEIKFNDSTGISIEGTLNAIGTVSDSILFTSSSGTPTKGIWLGIDIQNNSGGNAILQFCIFLYAENALRVECC
jgi:hypothetical protein